MIGARLGVMVTARLGAMFTARSESSRAKTNGR